jgi:ATP-dependent Lon protease
MIPLLPLRDIVVFPGMVVPLFVGRDKSIRALKEAMAGAKEIVLCAQREARTNDPEPEHIYEVGTLATIRQLIQLPDGTVKVLVMGERRVRVVRYLEEPRFYLVETVPLEARAEQGEALQALAAAVRETFDAYVKLNRRIPPDILTQIGKIEDVAQLADTIVAQLSIKLVDKQRVLEMEAVSERLERLKTLMQEEIEILQVERKIRSRVKKQQLDKGKEGENKGGVEGGGLADLPEFKNEIEELEEKIAQKKLPGEAAERANKELKKLKMMSPMSAEATVVRNYIDWLLALPWGEVSEERLDVSVAEGVLDADHFGLEKAKERILEYLAVRALVKQPRGPILCLVGPPGVGKTSLGRSIARALNREFVRLSLGGVRDEAEIRGHRRTYIGALPGKIIHAMKRAGKDNPVFLLDEIDKMTSDFRGDPSSALLEVLDPEQNATFNDHYLDLDYDLSRVMFVATANDLRGVPGPLQDRMEIIHISGYTEEEKLQIARRYLVPKQREANGLGGVDVRFTDAALMRVVEGYTREAGVRSLEREVGGICRKIAREVIRRGEAGEVVGSFEVKARAVSRYLGAERFAKPRREEGAEIGLTHGLAWTQAGGVMLVSEAAVMPGRGRLIITGKLGEVMQESAQAAMSYVRARALNLGLAPDFHQRVDLHVHFPEGALPKDGPSAGITMATSIVSCLVRIPVRADVAMTGEITLRGRVLPIGGLKEKMMAAYRSGIRLVIAPWDNRRDWDEVPASARRGLEVRWVKHMDEVLCAALELEDSEAFMARLSRPLLPPEALGGGAAGDESQDDVNEGVGEGAAATWQMLGEGKNEKS